MSIDLGSSGIKVLTADLAGDGTPRRSRLRRVAHRPRLRGGVLEWQVEEVVLDLVRAESRRCAGRELVVSVDGWGSDVAFLDRRGRRVGPLRSYRDPGLARGHAEVVRRGAGELVATRAGSAVTADSTLSQLYAWGAARPDWWPDVRTVLPLVDHLAARLTGEWTAGASPLSTTAFLDPRTGTVDRELLDALGVDERWFPDPVAEGFDAGGIVLPGVDPACRARLVKAAGHDTASALLAGYRGEGGRVFASIGSWAVVGVVCDDAARVRAPFPGLSGVTYELTGDGRLRVGRNVPGMRLLQRLEGEWLGEPAPPHLRAAWLAGLGAWDDEETLDATALDGQPAGGLDAWLRREGGRRGLPVATRAGRYAQALRAVARGIADAVADLAAAGLVSREPVWACGGGTAAGPLVAWVRELTGRDVEVGPAQASAEGGLRGAALVRIAAEREGWPG